MNHFSEEDKSRACKFYIDGLSQRAVGAKMGASDRTVSEWLKERSIPSRPGGHRPPTWTAKDRDRAAKLYQSGLSLADVGERTGWSPYTVSKMLDALGIQRRPCSGRGERASRWKGGKSRHTRGYVFLLKHDHPAASLNGYVYEHRLVMEEHLGRLLSSEEIVHHRNGDVTDNRIENLWLFASHKEHGKYHAALRRAPLLRKVSVKEWQEEIHAYAKAKGWWDDKDRNFGEMVALMHSELTEALEAWRNGNPLVYKGEGDKPEGIATEMADCVIRILDWAESEGVDLGEIMAAKHAYNLKRPHRHGGKRC